MKIQSIALSPVRKAFKNITFGNQQQLSNFGELKDVFEKAPVENKEDDIEIQEPSIRYYYLGADNKAHETTAPFITKQTEYGDRLYIIRSGKPRAFSGFTVEKNDDTKTTTIYESGYPHVVEEYEDEKNQKVTVYDKNNHRIQSIEKGAFKITQYYSKDSFSTEIREKKDGKNVRTILSVADDGDDISSAEIITSDYDGGNVEDNVIYWNYLGEVSDKLKNMDENVVKEFNKNLRNMAITIQSMEYFNNFGRNNKFNFTLEELIHYTNK